MVNATWVSGIELSAFSVSLQPSSQTGFAQGYFVQNPVIPYRVDYEVS